MVKLPIQQRQVYRITFQVLKIILPQHFLKAINVKDVFQINYQTPLLVHLVALVISDDKFQSLDHCHLTRFSEFRCFRIWKWVKIVNSCCIVKKICYKTSALRQSPMNLGLSNWIGLWIGSLDSLHFVYGVELK